MFSGSLAGAPRRGGTPKRSPSRAGRHEPEPAAQRVARIGVERQVILPIANDAAAVRYLVGSMQNLSNNRNHVEEAINNDRHHRALPIIPVRWFQPANRR